MNKKEYDKKYYQDNIEKIKEKKKNYRLENKKKIKNYRLENKEKLEEYHKKYYLENKEKLEEYHKKYLSENKEKVNKRQKKYLSENTKNITDLHIAILFRTSIKELRKYPKLIECKRVQIKILRKIKQESLTI